MSFIVEAGKDFFDEAGLSWEVAGPAITAIWRCRGRFYRAVVIDRLIGNVARGALFVTGFGLDPDGELEAESSKLAATGPGKVIRLDEAETVLALDLYGGPEFDARCFQAAFDELMARIPVVEERIAAVTAKRARARVAGEKKGLTTSGRIWREIERAITGDDDPHADRTDSKRWVLLLLAPVANKNAAILAIRKLTNLGLGDAKKLVDSAPTPLPGVYTQAEAIDAKAKLQAAGLQVKLAARG